MKLRFKLVEKFSNRYCSSQIRESVSTEDAIKLREKPNAQATLYGWKYKNQNDKTHKFGVDENYFDLSESLNENLYFDDIEDENMKEIFNYVMDECREKRLVPMSKIREMFNSTSLSKTEIVGYLQKFYNNEGGYNGLIAQDIDGDSYVGTPRLVQQRVEEVALMNKKKKSEEHSVATITSNADEKVEEVKSWLYDSTDDELKDVVDAVTSINVQIPNKQQYRIVARNIFGSDNVKKYINVTKSTENRAKYAMSATINFKKDKVDELPESIKSRLSTKNTISDVGLGIELFRMGAPLAKLKEE